MNEIRTRLRRMRGIQLILAGLVLAGGIATYALARPPRERAAPSGNTATGVIERFTTAPRGEVDGARLADGTLIHWPPHVGERVSGLMAAGFLAQYLGYNTFFYVFAGIAGLAAILFLTLMPETAAPASATRQQVRAFGA